MCVTLKSWEERVKRSLKGVGKRFTANNYLFYLSVNFGSRRMPPTTLSHVSFENRPRLHVLEAELAEE